MNRSVLTFALAAIIVVALGGPNTAEASFVSTTPDPFLGGAITLASPVSPPISTPLGFFNQFTNTNFVETSNTISGGNDVISYTSTTSFTIYSDSSLTNVVAHAVLQTVDQVTVLGRTSPFQTGTFNYQFNTLTASGVVNGTPITFELKPAQISQGTISITPGPGVGQFTIDAPALVYGQTSFNNGPFVTMPGLSTGTVPAPAAVPEPASIAMLFIGSSITGLIAMRRRRDS